MMFLKSLVLFLCMLVSVSYADDKGDVLETDYRFQGKHYNISYKLENDLQTIRLHGEILSGIVENLRGFKRVAKLIRKDIPIKLVLHSGGGFLEEIKRLEKSIKRNCDSETSDCRVTTIVPGWAYCASACVHLFMVGDERIAGSGSRFGFHQGALIPGAIKIPGYCQRTLGNRGVSKDWLKENKGLFDSLEMSWLYPRQMDGSEIITGLSEKYEY